MKVTRNTPDQLIVADTPWLIGLMMIFFIMVFVGAGMAMVLSGDMLGLLFIIVGGGLGIGAFAAFVRRVQVILDRPTDSITIRARTLFGYSEVRHKLSSLSRAVLQSTTSSKGNTLHRPALVLDQGMSAGDHPIVKTYANTGGAAHIVKAVNTWLDAKTPNS
ncbi:MAG: hypothetical protein ACI8R4_000446 [Paracoccaceae bacterium]|jgi:hypothetical protein